MGMMDTSPREMLILAGGFGTRLRSVVSDVPKPMAPVSGRPFLEYLLDYWIDQGVRRFVLSIGYKGDTIKEHFGTCYKNAEVSYVHETSPLGTGGAIRMALKEIQWSGDYILLANGDTWFEADLNKLVHATRQLGKPVTIALKVIEINDRYGGVTIDDRGLVTAFGVESKKNCLINVGCYLIYRQEISDLLSTYPEKFSFEEDLLKPLAAQKLVASSVQPLPFLDIGIPADYQNANEVVGYYKFKGISA
jgi:D-glycero-alpha-D-manno-heptose 1-phosphate guanylyltransferase